MKFIASILFVLICASCGHANPFTDPDKKDSYCWRVYPYDEYKRNKCFSNNESWNKSNHNDWYVKYKNLPQAMEKCAVCHTRGMNLIFFSNMYAMRQEIEKNYELAIDNFDIVKDIDNKNYLFDAKTIYILERAIKWELMPPTSFSNRYWGSRKLSDNETKSILEWINESKRVNNNLMNNGFEYNKITASILDGIVCRYKNDVSEKNKMKQDHMTYDVMKELNGPVSYPPGYEWMSLVQKLAEAGMSAVEHVKNDAFYCSYDIESYNKHKDAAIFLEKLYKTNLSAIFFYDGLMSKFYKTVRFDHVKTQLLGFDKDQYMNSNDFKFHMKSVKSDLLYFGFSELVDGVEKLKIWSVDRENEKITLLDESEHHKLSQFQKE